MGLSWCCYDRQKVISVLLFLQNHNIYFLSPYVKLILMIILWISVCMELGGLEEILRIAFGANAVLHTRGIGIAHAAWTMDL